MSASVRSYDRWHYISSQGSGARAAWDSLSTTKSKRLRYRTASDAVRDRRFTTVTALTPTNSKPQIAIARYALR